MVMKKRLIFGYILLALVLLAGWAGWLFTNKVSPQPVTAPAPGASIQQLQYYTALAAKYLDWKLKEIGGAGPVVARDLSDVRAMATNATEPVTAQQLIVAAQPFYDRLNAAGFNTTADIKQRIGGGIDWRSQYPWKEPEAQNSKTTPVQLDQIKFVFGFDLSNFTVSDDLSTNAAGVPDKWIVANGLDPFDANVGSEDPDHDLLSNAEEYQSNTDPHNPDTDGDGVPDGSDAVPYDARFTFPKQPMQSFATIDLGEGEVISSTDDGSVLIRKKPAHGDKSDVAYTAWLAGQTIDVPSTDKAGNQYRWVAIAGQNLISGFQLSPDGKSVRPARWKPGDASPAVLTSEKLMAATPEGASGEAIQDVPVGPNYVCIGGGGILFMAVYNHEFEHHRYEEARLFFWDINDNIVTKGGAFGSGPAYSMHRVSLQSIQLAGAPGVDLVYEIEGDNVPDSSGGWHTANITSRLLLNGKLVPGSAKTVSPPDLLKDLPLADMGRLADAQNLTHPIIPDFFGNHTLYMDPGGDAPLVAVDWPAGPRHQGVVHFAEINAVGVGTTTDGKSWGNGFVQEQPDFNTPPDKKLVIKDSILANNGAMRAASIIYANDEAKADKVQNANPEKASTQPGLREFKGIIPASGREPPCAAKYDGSQVSAGSQAIVPTASGNASLR